LVLIGEGHGVGLSLGVGEGIEVRTLTKQVGDSIDQLFASGGTESCPNGSLGAGQFDDNPYVPERGISGVRLIRDVERIFRAQENLPTALKFSVGEDRIESRSTGMRLSLFFF